MSTINSASLLTTQNHVHRIKSTLNVSKWALMAIGFMAIGFAFSGAAASNSPLMFKTTLILGVGLGGTAATLSLASIALYYVRSHLRKQLTPANFLIVLKRSEPESLELLNSMSKKTFRNFLASLDENENNSNLIMNLGMMNPEKLASNLMDIKAPLFEKIFQMSGKQRLQEIVATKTAMLRRGLNTQNYFSYAKQFGKAQTPPDVFGPSMIPADQAIVSFTARIQPEITNLQKNLDVISRG